MSVEIPNSYYMARYCNPSTINENIIKLTTFKIKYNEEFLSWNYIYNTIDMNAGRKQVLHTLEQKINIRENGRLVIVNVEAIKKHVYDAVRIEISIRYQPAQLDPTHAGIFLYNLDETNRQQQIDDLTFALFTFVQEYPDTIYPVKM